jgi:hypothetical protein
MAKKLLIVFLLLCALVLLTGSASASYAYERVITITGSTGGAVNDYPYVFSLYNVSGSNNGNNIYLGSHVLTNTFNDIRFTDMSDNVLPYKVLMYYPNHIDVAVNLDVPAWPSTIQIKLKYGMAGDLSGENGKATFNFLADFSGQDLLKKVSFMQATLPEEEGYICEPQVIYDTNPQILTGNAYVFKMWYRGSYANPRVFYAESTDGFTWTKYGKVEMAESQYFCPYVFKLGSIYYMYASTKTWDRVDFWSSYDGIHWSNTHWDVLTPGSWDTIWGNRYVWRDTDGFLYMIYEARTDTATWSIGLARSTNGLTWTKLNGGNPVLTETNNGVGNPDIHKVGNTYYMIMHKAVGSNLPTDIYQYSSTDLIHWSACNNGLPIAQRLYAFEGAQSARGQLADPCYLSANGRTYAYIHASTDGATENPAFAAIECCYSPLPFDSFLTSTQGLSFKMSDFWNGFNSSNNGSVVNGQLNLKDTVYSRELRTTATYGYNTVAFFKYSNDFTSGDQVQVGYNVFNPSQGQEEAVYTTWGIAPINHGFYTCQGTTGSNDYPLSNMPGGTQLIKIGYTNGKCVLYVNNELKSIKTTNIPTTARPLSFSTKTNLLKIDMIAEGNYVTPEPTATVGNENAGADTEYYLTGYVRSANAPYNAISGATVSFKLGTTVITSVQSGLDGSYRFILTGLTQNTYTVSVTATNYVTPSGINIIFPYDFNIDTRTCSLDLILSPQATPTPTATPTPAPATIGLWDTQKEVNEGYMVWVDIAKFGDLNTECSAWVRTVDGTAKAGTDYQAVNKQIHFNGAPYPQNADYITINTSRDWRSSGDKTFTVELYNPTGCTLTGGKTTLTVNIRDMDSGTPNYLLQAQTYNVQTYLRATNVKVVVVDGNNNIIGQNTTNLNGDCDIWIPSNTPAGTYFAKAIQDSKWGNQTATSIRSFVFPDDFTSGGYKNYATIGVSDLAAPNTVSFEIVAFDWRANMNIKNIRITLTAPDSEVVFDGYTDNGGSVRGSVDCAVYTLHAYGAGVYQDITGSFDLSEPNYVYTILRFDTVTVVPTPTPTVQPTVTPTPTPNPNPIVPDGTNLGGWWTSILNSLGFTDPTVCATITGLFVILICCAIMGTVGGEAHVSGTTMAYLVMVGAAIGLLANCISGIWPIWIIFIIFVIAAAAVAWKFGGGNGGSG